MAGVDCISGGSWKLTEDEGKIRLNSSSCGCVNVEVVRGDLDITEKPRNPEKVEKHRKRVRERYGVFVKTMKRMGYSDNRTMPRSINPEHVLEELLKIAQQEEEEQHVAAGSLTKSWNLDKVIRLLREYRLGQSRTLDPEVNQMFWKAVHDLGPEVTPEAIFDTFDESTKEKTPLHIIRYKLGYHLEVQKNHRLRRQVPPHLGTDGLFVLSDSLGYERVPPFFKEVQDLKDKYDRIEMEHYRTFLKAMKQLGGHDNLSNITADALLKLILEELDPANEDFYWTLTNVQTLLYSYHYGHCPDWTWKHHNKMLKAIDHLAAGDVFDEDRVNPKAVLEFMENDMDGDQDDALDCLTNIWGVTTALELFRGTLKNHPDDPIRFPKQSPTTKRPRRLMFF